VGGWGGAAARSLLPGCSAVSSHAAAELSWPTARLGHPRPPSHVRLAASLLRPTHPRPSADPPARDPTQPPQSPTTIPTHHPPPRCPPAGHPVPCGARRGVPRRLEARWAEARPRPACGGAGAPGHRGAILPRPPPGPPPPGQPAGAAALAPMQPSSACAHPPTAARAVPCFVAQSCRRQGHGGGPREEPRVLCCSWWVAG
jgi:hypothetical protein